MSKDSRIYTKPEGKKAFVRMKATLEKQESQLLESTEVLKKAEKAVEQMVEK